MPAPVTELPDNLKPYRFHGIDLRIAGDEAVADCPWCGREGKFSVHIPTSKWRCLVCNDGEGNGPIRGGNAYTLIRLLHQRAVETTKPEELEGLAQDRRLLGADGLKDWGVCRSFLTRDWLVPGFNVDGKLTQLYRYITINGKRRLLPTPTLGHALFGVNTYKANCDEVFLCEGPWDAIALYELLDHAEPCDEGVRVLRPGGRPLSRGACVLAVPGCETFFDSWRRLFSGKILHLMYDNDHERIHPKTGQTIAPAAWGAMKRLAGILMKNGDSPSGINYLAWGEGGGASFDPRLASGYDVRDFLADVST